MHSFFKPKPKAPKPEMLFWKTTKSFGDTTARVDINVRARVGSFVMHTEHGKVTLVGQPAPDKLEIEIKTDTIFAMACAWRHYHLAQDRGRGGVLRSDRCCMCS